MAAQSLPSETLHDIFLHALPSVATSSEPIDPFNLPPLSFSAVCRFWKEVVESHTDLWSSIHVVQDDSSKPFGRSVIRFVQTWLEKSDRSLLDIHIRLKTCRTESYRICDELLRTLHWVMDRCELVDIDIFETGSFEPTSDVEDLRLPISLQCSSVTRSFRLSLNPCPVVPHAFLSLFHCCPALGHSASQLRELSLCRDVTLLFARQKDSLLLHLPNLRDLTIELDNFGIIDNALCVLSASSNLEVLNVTAYETPPPHSPPEDSEPICLSQLKHLSITSCNDTTPYLLLDSLRCPTLDSFSFRVFIGIGFRLQGQGGIVELRFLDHILKFFRRSCGEDPGLPLTVLSIRYFVGNLPSKPFPPYARALEEILFLCDDLECLELRGMVIDDETIKALTLGEGVARGRFAAPLCPSLYEIVFVCETDFGMQEKSVADMIVSRWESEENLEAIAFSVPSFKELGRQNERVMFCIREGLDFYYNPGTPKIEV